MPLKVIIVLITLLYPFLVYWGLQHFEAIALIPLLAVVLVMRWFGGKKNHEKPVVLLTLLGLVLIVITWGAQQGLKFYPVLVNFSMLVLFAGSLYSDQSIVERIARLKDPNLPAAGVAYTRKVTKAWSLFFIFNGTVAATTAVWASEEVWLLYNGLLAYLLMGLLAGLEWIIRQRVKRDI